MISLDASLDLLRNFVAGRLPRFSRSIVAVWLATFAFIAILLSGWIHTKTTIERQLREHVLAIAQLAADRTALAFDSVGKAMQAIGDSVQAEDMDIARGITPGRRLALQATLIRVRGRHSSVVSLLVTDPAGRTLAVAPFHADGSALAIRQKDIPPLAQGDRGGPAVSAPFRDPVSGRWLVRMTHRISGTSGMTAGIVIANVAIGETLATFLHQYPFEEGDVVALHDSADRQLAVFQNGRDPVGDQVRNPAAGMAIAAESTDSPHYTPSPDNDSVHLVAARRLAGYPFYVVYGKSVDAWLLKWRQEQFVLALAALAAVIVTAAIAAGIQRRLQLTGQLQKVRGDLEESNAALRATLAAAELLAARDQLTGLCNRRNFDQRLEAAIARAARHGDTFSLLMLDLDHFKNINDYYGHATGDDVLRRFGDVLRERLRQNDVAARWGGEEFVVLADGANLENARMLAEQVRESVATTPFSPVPRVTVSIGIAEYREGESGDDLLKRADKALYGAKRNGRNRVIAAEGSQMLKRQSA